ncbi:MAG TPA: hypothetical protein V6C72_12340, partial [Chroococcales cyanobacterium]
ANQIIRGQGGSGVVTTHILLPSMTIFAASACGAVNDPWFHIGAKVDRSDLGAALGQAFGG